MDSLSKAFRALAVGAQRTSRATLKGDSKSRRKSLDPETALRANIKGFIRVCIPSRGGSHQRKLHRKDSQDAAFLPPYDVSKNPFRRRFKLPLTSKPESMVLSRPADKVVVELRDGLDDLSLKDGPEPMAVDFTMDDVAVPMDVDSRDDDVMMVDDIMETPLPRFPSSSRYFAPPGLSSVSTWAAKASYTMTAPDLEEPSSEPVALPAVCSSFPMQINHAPHPIVVSSSVPAPSYSYPSVGATGFRNGVWQAQHQPMSASLGPGVAAQPLTGGPEVPRALQPASGGEVVLPPDHAVRPRPYVLPLSVAPGFAIFW